MAGKPEATAFLRSIEKGFFFLTTAAFSTGWQATASALINKVLLEHSHTQQSGTDSPTETTCPVSLNYL